MIRLFLIFLLIPLASRTFPGEGTNQNQKFGSIQVTSKPESGMAIFINDRNTGKVTPYTFEGLSAGEYQVKLVNQWYQSQTRKVVITDERTQLIAFTLRPIFAELTLNTPFDAKIFVNNQLVGTSGWTGRVAEGICKVRVEKQGFKTKEFQLSIVAGKKEKVDVKLDTFSGNLEISSEPSGAIITINGTIYGLTPFTIRDLSVGNYSVTLTKAGFTTLIVPTEVKSGLTTKIQGKLLSGKQIGITSEPSGANIFINDSLYGLTPRSIFLEYGEYNIKLTKGTLVLVDKVHVTQVGGNTYAFKLKETNDPLENQMVFVKGGTFRMGDTFGDGKKFEKPVREVTISDFYISKFEITQEIWVQLMGSNPSHFNNCENCPVERVTWSQAQEFLSRLNNLTGKQYRLPTEAEWEYAARGGEKTLNHRYAGARNINDVAWYSGNSGNNTNEVGQLKPNELGIYDMSGNVWEWCSDWFALYPNNPESNPVGPQVGDGKVVRGGSWFGYIGACRITFRGFDDPANSRSYIGFRVVLSNNP